MKDINTRSIWLLAAILFVFALAACQSPAETPTETTPAVAATEPALLEDLSLVGTPDPTPEPIVLDGATVTDSGLQFLDIEKGDGRAPADGDLISMHYVASLPDGTELFSSYTEDRPLTVMFNSDQLLPGWDEGVALMKVGGKAKLVLPPELAFGEQGSGMIPPNSQLVMEVALLSAEPAPMPAEIAAADLKSNESGLQYAELVKGNGEEAVDKNTVTMHYTIWLRGEESDSYIVSSQGLEPITFVLGRGDMVFPGWDEGVVGMKVGGTRQLIIPPDLALGEMGGGQIPPNATLVMEIELTDSVEPRLPMEIDEEDFTTTESGLMYYDIEEGDGATPETGQTVVVDYTGWLEDGTQFDSSIDRGQPFSFPLGTGSVIPGWDEGLSTMKVGGKRQLIIPAELGYGDAGSGALIPPGATLIFEVELLEIQP